MDIDGDMIMEDTANDDSAIVVNAVRDIALKIEYQQWLQSYSTQDIPRSYWISRGFDDEYAHKMEKFVCKMKEIANKLRKGGPLAEIDLWNRSGCMFFHDDVLLPHWRDFVEALTQYAKFAYRKDHGVESFIIWNVELHKKVLAMLNPALKTTNMKGLILGYNEFGSDGISFMSEILSSNPFIEGVGLRENQIDTVDDMRCICNSIMRRPDYPQCQFGLLSSFNGNDPELLQTIIDASRHLEKILISGNGIGTLGADIISDFLASNPPLKMIDLGDNNLSDVDAVLIADSLLTNTNLETIYLGNNEFTHIGRRAMMEALFDASSLESCIESHHNCQVHGLISDISEINKFVDSGKNKAMKIFTVLSATEDGFFDLNCFGELTYKLIPKMLCLAQRFGGGDVTPELSSACYEQTGRQGANRNQHLGPDTVALSSVFELLRGWAVPSL